MAAAAATIQQQLKPRSVLRLLLRTVDRHITAVAGNQQWRQHVLQQFRQGRGADAAQAQRMLLLAQEYANLVSNIAHHQALLETYNIGVDPDTRNKDMVEKTAARVGFRLPPDAAAGAIADASAPAGSSSSSNERQQPHQAGVEEEQQQRQQPDSRAHETQQQQPQQQPLAAAATSSSSIQQGWPQQPSQPQAPSHAAAAAAASPPPPPPAAAAVTL